MKNILIILSIFVLGLNLYAFSFNDFTAKLDVDRANRLLRKGDYDGAISLYEKALSKVPNSPEIFYNMGITMSSIGEFDSAVQLFDMAKKNTTEKTKKEMKSAIHYNSGITRIEKKDYEEAIDEFIESLVNTPDDKNAKRALEYAQKRLDEQNKNNNSGNRSQNQQEQNNNDNENNRGGKPSDEDNNNPNDNQGGNNQSNNDEQHSEQDNNDQQNNSSQNKDENKSDIDKLLESLRQLRKDKDNRDQYYGGGRIDKDW